MGSGEHRYYLLWINRNGMRQWNGAYRSADAARGALRMLHDAHNPLIVRLHQDLTEMGVAEYEPT